MLITVVIPVYNVERYLRECLDSLCAQTFADWEAVCVDDGSADGSGAILEEYARRDRRIRVIRQANGGPGVARDAALPLARGDWIGFLDADDWVGPDWLQQAADELVARPVDLVRCGFRHLFGDRRIVERRRTRSFDLSGADEVMRWGWTTWWKEAMVWRCFYRREMILSSGVSFGTGSVLEDMFFNLNLLPHIRSARQIGNDGYVYRQRDGSLIHGGRDFRGTERILLDGLKVYEAQRRRLKEMGLVPAAFRQVFAVVWGNVGMWLRTHPRDEAKLKGEVRRLARRVLEPCANDRFPTCAAPVRRAIAGGLALLAASGAAHAVCRGAYALAWNARDAVRRLKRGAR